jgi:hypothetical protein
MDIRFSRVEMPVTDFLIMSRITLPVFVAPAPALAQNVRHEETDGGGPGYKDAGAASLTLLKYTREE